MRYFIGNWKMFGVPKSINILKKINSFYSLDKNRKKYRVIITPPYTLIETYAKYFKNMLDLGIYLPPSQYECCFFSTALSEIDIDKIIKSNKIAIKNL